MPRRLFVLCILLFTTLWTIAARGDIVVVSDGRLIDGKITATDDKSLSIETDDGSTHETTKLSRDEIQRAVYTDEHGAAVPSPATGGPATRPAAPKWDVPPEPAAPKISVSPAGAKTFYVIPLHGEVGHTVLASALEKSFADALLRKPTVVVLDIDSPGGLVAESEKIMRVISHYKKKLRMVALCDQDLSAAAIFTLSIKEIYLKPTGTIGAATSFIPNQPQLSEKVEEKMQSAWRAVARNSAEEGGHEPLLADAMIDNDMELHLENDTAGKPIVKEGPGDKTLCRKGKILTLTSHEAVECGLAAGDADDTAELGELLGMKGWTECKGLGVVLADYLPRRDESFQSQIKKVIADFSANIEQAQQSDPTQQTMTVYSVHGPPQPPRRPVIIGPNGRPRYVPGPPQIPSPGQQTVRVRNTSPREWKSKSLRCVLSLQAAEANLQDAVSLCNAFGQEAVAESVNDALTRMSAVRAKIYDDRNHYGATPAIAQAQPQPQPSPQPQPDAPVGPINPPVRRVRPSEVATLPTPADADAQLKSIEKGWQPTTAAPVELLASMERGPRVTEADGNVMLSRGGRITTKESYSAPATFRMVVLTNIKDLRVGYAAQQIIFNWEMRHDELRVDGGPAAGKYKPGAGQLPANQWVGIELVVHADEMIIYVNGEKRYDVQADFSMVNQPFSISGHGGEVAVKSITVLQGK